MFIGVFLVILWFALSGLLTALPLIPGLLFIIVILVLMQQTNFKLNYHLGFNVKRLEYVFFYIPYMVKEIILANIHVAKVILKNQINPKIIKVENVMECKSLLVNLANSITLTPGTLVLYVSSKAYIIHSLDEHSKEGILQNTMFIKNKELEPNNTKDI